MKTMTLIAATLALLASAAVAAQQRIDAPGTVAHAPAGTGFPERIGEFRRFSVTRYDQAGRDIGANYDLVRPQGRVRASIYIYPAVANGSAPAGESARTRHCRDEFAAVEQAIGQQHRDARLVERASAPAVAGVDPRYSHRSIHSFTADFGGGVEEVRSESRLYCFVGGDWLVKYRISISPGLDADEAIESLIRNGPWPGRAPPETIVALATPSARL